MCCVCTKTYTSASDVVEEPLQSGATVHVCRSCCEENAASRVAAYASKAGNGVAAGNGAGNGGDQPLNMCLKARKRTRSEDEEESNGGRDEERGESSKENPTKFRKSGDVEKNR